MMERHIGKARYLKRRTNNWVVGLFLVLIINGCATLFLPRKQNVTVSVVDVDSAEVFVDGVEFGSDTLHKERIKRIGTRQVVLRAPGYWNQSEALPAVYRPGGFWFCQLLNVPLLWGIVIDLDETKNFAYKKKNFYKMQRSQIPMRQGTQEKHLQPGRLSLVFDDTYMDFISVEVMYHPDSLEFNKGIANALEQRRKELRRERKKAERKRKEKDKVVEERRKALERESYNTNKASEVLRFRLLDVMVESGFLDTSSNILQDPNNTLRLNAEVNSIVFCEALNRRWYSMFTNATMEVVWHITDNYGEWIASIPIRATSGNFSYTGNGLSSYESSFFDALSYAYLQLLQHPEFKKIIKIEHDYSSHDALLTLNPPNDTVSSLTEAMAATVVVKTKDNQGTGFAINNDGYIITNYHVITGSEGGLSKDLTIVDKSGKSHTARVVRVNKYRDIALLKVHAPFEKAFKVSADSSFELLETINCIGAPESAVAAPTVSMGILSGVRRSGLLHLLQLNMTVHSGYSGGPVFNDDGDLLGVVHSKLVGQYVEGIAFAVPGHRLFEYLNLSY
ncbi:MAG: S1 family peptidase [Bacteroidia bacterium]